MAPIANSADGAETVPDEAALRARIYQLECAIDAARRDPGRGNLFALVAERDDAVALLRSLDPPEAALGDQHNPHHVREDPEGRPPIPSPSESGGGAAFG